MIDDGELLVGKFSDRPLTDAEAEEHTNWWRYGAPSTGVVPGQRAHMAIDFARVLRLGVAGVREQITHGSARRAFAPIHAAR